MRRSSASGASAMTPSKNCPVSSFQRRKYARRIGGFASSESSSPPIASRWRPRRNSLRRGPPRFGTPLFLADDPEAAEVRKPQVEDDDVGWRVRLPLVGPAHAFELR